MGISKVCFKNCFSRTFSKNLGFFTILALVAAAFVAISTAGSGMVLMGIIISTLATFGIVIGFFALTSLINCLISCS